MQNAFFDQMKQALETIQDPARLGEGSPLAAPYFLGAALQGVDPSPLERGKVLQRELGRSLESLWGAALPAEGQAMVDAVMDEEADGGRYDCLILALNYFKSRFRPPPRNQSEIYNDILHISRPTHDRHLRAAVERLGARLLQRLRPTVRPEQPPYPPYLLQREEIQTRILADLAAGLRVSLTGAGGVGKSSLAATVGGEWISPALFWYTFRPSLNDQLESLLFALGHFLHGQGASGLWQQLIADGGQVRDPALALGLAISDLTGLTQRPLLCFDEMDSLRPVNLDQPNPDHEQLLAFMESLGGHAPQLLIGQRAFWESDVIHRLEGLSQSGLAELLALRHIPCTDDELQRLYAYSQGNLRLAELCLALYQSAEGDSLAAALDQLPRAPTLLPLWHRLQRRLPASQRQLLQALSVFRSPAPADGWQSDPEQFAALHELLERRLVQQDGQGGVALLPALREVILEDMPVESREGWHAQAAQMRAERGDYTPAAHHLFQAGQPDAALALWYPQRSGEINRGQAGAALAIFAQISLNRLSGRQQKELLLLRSELYQLRGEPERVTAELEQAAWSVDDPNTPAATLIQGQALDAQGRPDQALRSYQEGLDAAAYLLRQSTELYVQRSLTHLRQREMPQARREANLARFHAETMLGVVQDQQGDYTAARTHYQIALAISEEADYAPGLAQTHHNLAILASRQQLMAQALPHFEQAMTFYEHIGDQVNLESVRGNLASAYIQARDFSAAIEPAQRALHFFERMGNPYRVALNASNLAEAYAELGDLGAAERYAGMVLDQEEPHSHSYALFTLGRVASARQEWARAEACYNHARRQAEASDDTYLQAYAWRSLGELYLATERPDPVRNCLSQALILFQRLQMAAEITQTEKLLEQVDAKEVDFDA